MLDTRQKELQREAIGHTLHNCADCFALSCKDLTFSVNNKTLIDTVNLSFAERGMTALMGFNGAGKSLLLRLLHGIVRPVSGSVLWNGAPVKADIRKRQSMVFQKPVLLRRTVLENIRFVQKNRSVGDVDTAMALLEEVGLGAVAGRAARLLSGGEQQRLSLARALATRPDVLFLDEATASLDPASIAIIEAILKQEDAKCTKIFFASHDTGQVKRLASEVIFIHGGKVAEQAGADCFFNNTLSHPARAYLEGRLPDPATMKGLQS